MKTSSLASSLFVASGFYTVLLYVFADQIAEYSRNSDPWLALGLYFLTQPLIILAVVVAVLYTQSTNRGTLRGIVGGFMLGVWGEAISLSHCVTATAFPTETINYACIDTLLIKIFVNAGIPYGVSYTLYYLIFPILLLVGALMILGNVGFTEFFKGAKMRR
jgi:hypothetical protein